MILPLIGFTSSCLTFGYLSFRGPPPSPPLLVSVSFVIKTVDKTSDSVEFGEGVEVGGGWETGE